MDNFSRTTNRASSRKFRGFGILASTVVVLASASLVFAQLQAGKKKMPAPPLSAAARGKAPVVVKAAAPVPVVTVVTNSGSISHGRLRGLAYFAPQVRAYEDTMVANSFSFAHSKHLDLVDSQLHLDRLKADESENEYIIRENRRHYNEWYSDFKAHQATYDPTPPSEEDFVDPRDLVADLQEGEANYLLAKWENDQAANSLNHWELVRSRLRQNYDPLREFILFPPASNDSEAVNYFHVHEGANYGRAWHVNLPPEYSFVNPIRDVHVTSLVDVPEYDITKLADNNMYIVFTPSGPTAGTFQINFDLNWLGTEAQAIQTGTFSIKGGQFTGTFGAFVLRPGPEDFDLRGGERGRVLDALKQKWQPVAKTVIDSWKVIFGSGAAVPVNFMNFDRCTFDVSGKTLADGTVISEPATLDRVY